MAVYACVCVCTYVMAQATPKVSLTKEELEALTVRTQDGGTEVVQAKAGKVRCTQPLHTARTLLTGCSRGVQASSTSPLQFASCWS